VFNTALSFFLAGAALTLRVTRLDFEGRLRTFLACAMGLLAMLALAENLSAIDLGIDWPQLHQWLLDKNAHPGRMAPNTPATMVPVAAITGRGPIAGSYVLPATTRVTRAKAHIAASASTVARLAERSGQTRDAPRSTDRRRVVKSPMSTVQPAVCHR